ncbi:MAG: hemerythrin domain-containing protein [Nanoarchaeota archaeon]
MEAIQILKKEHLKIQELLLEIENALNEKEPHSYTIILKFNNLGVFWDKHEKKEERFLDFIAKNRKDFPVEKMLLEQHRELRGHWRVLQEAIHSRSGIPLQVALDTDGRMLIDKFRKHIFLEEEFFDSKVNFHKTSHPTEKNQNKLLAHTSNYQPSIN